MHLALLLQNSFSKIIDNNYGYERIALHWVTANGTVILERKIGDTKTNVNGTDPTVDHGTYSVCHKAKKNINTVYLHLLEIDEVHSVRSAENGSKTQDLTWRSILHIFFIQQQMLQGKTLHYWHHGVLDVQRLLLSCYIF